MGQGQRLRRLHQRHREQPAFLCAVARKECCQPFEGGDAALHRQPEVILRQPKRGAEPLQVGGGRTTGLLPMGTHHTTSTPQRRRRGDRLRGHPRRRDGEARHAERAHQTAGGRKATGGGEGKLHRQHDARAAHAAQHHQRLRRSAPLHLRRRGAQALHRHHGPQHRHADAHLPEHPLPLHRRCHGSAHEAERRGLRSILRRKRPQDG